MTRFLGRIKCWLERHDDETFIESTATRWWNRSVCRRCGRVKDSTKIGKMLQFPLTDARRKH